MKVIIAGGRDFNNSTLMESKLERIFANKRPDVVICGMAKGADIEGRIWAERHGVKVEEYPANWDLYGKRAGYVRNAHMAENATHLVAFWDGRSKGTKNMIDIAVERGLTIRVVRY